MMKSFFKKLAFVMALAMVVSMVTPAGAVFAADAAGIALQTAKSDAEILESDNIAVDATVDYKFYGCANWKTRGLKWTSSNEAVATVDQTGKITGVADGVATINLKSADGTYDVSIEITVGAGDVTLPAYEVKQVSHIEAEITLNSDAKYTKDDLVLTRVFDGGFEVDWQIDEFEQEDNVITFAPYVDFADGDNYIIKVGAGDEGTPFTTTIGDVDYVALSYKTLGVGDMGEGKAYTNGEDGDELTVQITPTLYSKGVDVTEVYNTEDVVYTLAKDNEYAMIDEYAGTIVFSKAGEGVVVNANYVYYDENDEEHKIPAVLPMVSEMAPAYTITGVKEWTIASGDYLAGTEKINWSKPVHKVPAGEDVEYKIVALLTDNYGNIISTVDDLKHSVDDVVDFEDSRLKDENCYVQYTSANVNKLLVGTDGELTTFVKTSVPVIVSLHDEDLETETQLVKNLYAATVNVDAERKFDKLKISKSSITLLTDGSYNTEDFDLRVYDQYGDEWKGTDKDVELEVDCSVDGVTGLPNWATSFNRKYPFELDGSAIESSKSSFTLTFTVEGKSQTLKVTLKDPKTDSDGNVKITSYDLVAKDAVTGESTVNQTVGEQEDYDDSDKYNGSVDVDIRYYTLSNGYKYGVVDTVSVKTVEKVGDEEVEVYVDTPLTLVTEPEQLELTTADVLKGQQFIVVYDPDGNILGAADKNDYGLGLTEIEPGKYTVTVANDIDKKMHYAENGTYTVKVLQVSSFNKKDEAVYSPKYTETFKVINENAVVKFLEQAEIETDETDIKEIVKDAIVFSLGGSEWDDFDASMVESVDYAENKKSGYIVIKSVKINVPLNGDDDNIYYQVEADVNKAVKVPSGFWK